MAWSFSRSTEHPPGGKPSAEERWRPFSSSQRTFREKSGLGFCNRIPGIAVQLFGSRCGQDAYTAACTREQAQLAQMCCVDLHRGFGDVSARDFFVAAPRRFRRAPPRAATGESEAKVPSEPSAARFFGRDPTASGSRTAERLRRPTAIISGLTTDSPRRAADGLSASSSPSMVLSR